VTRPQGLRRFTGAPQQAPTPAGPAAAGPPPAAAPAAAGAQSGAGEERCEFCATGIPGAHGHVADLEQSSLMCACRACYLLFTASVRGGDPPDPPGSTGSGGTPLRGAPRRRGSARYRSVPDRYLRDPDRRLTAAEWDELQIPVGLAFFLYRSDRGELGCFYPSPAGATECALDLPAWQRMAAAHPLLGRAEPDVEAVLISQDESAGVEYFIVPIDACYELAGRMRMLWRGFDGGTEARESIAEFLAGVRKRARDAPREPSHG
jgi:hypothetical protein